MTDLKNGQTTSQYMKGKIREALNDAASGRYFHDGSKLTLADLGEDVIEHWDEVVDILYPQWNKQETLENG
jgi:hypothetical protein